METTKTRECMEWMMEEMKKQTDKIDEMVKLLKSMEKLLDKIEKKL